MDLEGFIFPCGFVQNFLNCCRLVVHASYCGTGICGRTTHFLNSCSTSACLCVFFQGRVQRNLNTQMTRKACWWPNYESFGGKSQLEESCGVLSLRWHIPSWQYPSSCNSSTGRRRWTQWMEEVEMEVRDFCSYQALIFFFSFFFHLHIFPLSLSHAGSHPWSVWKTAGAGWMAWLEQGYREAVSTYPLPACVGHPSGAALSFAPHRQCLSHISRVLPQCLPMAHVHFDVYSSLSESYLYLSESCEVKV